MNLSVIGEESVRIIPARLMNRDDSPFDSAGLTASSKSDAYSRKFRTFLRFLLVRVTDFFFRSASFFVSLILSFRFSAYVLSFLFEFRSLLPHAFHTYVSFFVILFSNRRRKIVDNFRMYVIFDS